MDGFPQLCLQPDTGKHFDWRNAKGDKEGTIEFKSTICSLKAVFWWQYGYLSAGNRKYVEN